MADQEQRAFVGLQQLFEQFEGFDVEVVGRFVENQHVGRLGEQAGEQQAVALAAGQRTDRRPRPFRREQEVFEVADDVLAGAADLDVIRARRNHVGQRRVRIELGTELVEVGDFHLRALAHDAGIRLQLAEDEAEQRRLAGAVGADQADLVATLDAGGKVAHDLALAISLVDMLQLGDQLAALVAGIELQIDLAHPLAAGLAFGTQLVETLDAEYRTRAPGLDPLADPHLLFLEQLVGAGIGQRLLVQHGFLALLVLRETAGKTGQLAAVEFDDAGAHAVEEGTVVGDEEQRDTAFDEQVFQPFDGGDVEVVGRLVEEQHLGRHGQGLGQGQALFLAAGQGADAGLRIESETVDHPLGLCLVSPGATGFQLMLQGIHAGEQGIVIAQPFGQLVRHVVVLGEQGRGFAHAGDHGLEDGHRRVERRLLRHVADTYAGLHPDFAIVQPPPAGSGRHGGEQRGFAGAVAADQGDPLTGVELEIGMIEKRHMAVGKTGSGKFEVGHRSQ